MSARLTVAGRFHVDDPARDLLGRGGMGAVYRGTDTMTGASVAVKVLDQTSEVCETSEVFVRFAREAEALRRLNHPNIVHMVAAVEEGGRHYLVMEYVPGGSLRDVLEKQGRLPAQRVMEIALDLADALTRAHRLGILHRDLKPENVLLAADGTPRMADFGLARLAGGSRLTQSGMLMGTVDYVSPEACQGESPDERSDIWSLGVLLFEMLTDRLPFPGDTFAARLNAILTLPVPDLAQLAPGVSDGLADLVYRMLEKDPCQRIPSVRLVGAELEAILKGREAVTPARGRAAESRFASPTPPVGGPKHNLLAQTTPFVGRQAELVELARLLEDPSVRLVSIVGLGGMGKTRLAMEAAVAQLDHFKHGVYFVPLAPLQSAEAIVPAIAGAVGLAFREGGEPRQQLLDHLRDRAVLLILDNFEHLLEGTDLVTGLLQAAPAAKVLVTTRARLNVQSEQLFQLSAMDVPDRDSAADAASYSAVRLFLQSARRVRPGFELDADSLRHVTRICRLVGGTPLGILLAAAWVGMLAPAEIAEEIGRSLDFLETELRDVPERQRSLRAVFEHSWGLLTEREREVFRGLSVFRGGFTREAAQQVTGASLRELMGLVDKSLLQRAPTGRYDVHELLRQYAAERLVESGEEDAIRGRHLEYYLLLGETARPQQVGTVQAHGLQRLAPEHDNFRAALAWSLESGRAETGLRLAACLRAFWSSGRSYHEARDWLERLLAAAPQPTMVRCRALVDLAFSAHRLGHYGLSRAAGEEGLALAEALGDPKALADAAFQLSWPILSLGDPAGSQRLMERSLALYQAVDEPLEAAFVVAMMGEVARAAGDLVRARTLDEQAVELHRSLPDNRRLAVAVGNLGCVLVQFGEFERSRVLLSECLALYLETDSEITPVLEALAILAGARGQPVRAARLLGADEALRRTTGRSVDPGDRPDYERTLASVRSQLGEVAFAAAWAEGAALTEEQAVALALSEEP